MSAVPPDPFAEEIPALFFLFRAVALCNEAQALTQPTPLLSKYDQKMIHTRTR